MGCTVSLYNLKLNFITSYSVSVFKPSMCHHALAHSLMRTMAHAAHATAKFQIVNL